MLLNQKYTSTVIKYLFHNKSVIKCYRVTFGSQMNQWNEMKMKTLLYKSVCVCTLGNGFWKACIANIIGAAVLQLKYLHR